MSDYTPPTNEVRHWYALGLGRRSARRRGSEFDRWLAEVLAEEAGDEDWYRQEVCS